MSWELRTVNHRYLEIQLKLPENLRALEPVLREAAAAQLGRGKLDATLNFQPAGDQPPQLQLNRPLAKQVIEYAQDLMREVGSSAPLRVMEVLSWPGVVSELDTPTDELVGPTSALLDETLGTLRGMREREGQRIEKLLEQRLANVSRSVSEVRKRYPEVLEQIRNRLRERAQALEVRVDAERLEQELLLIAQKLDVAEELDRLDAHVEETRRALKTEGPVGRRLDFLMQELNREANTLASKSADPETTRHAVDLKVTIEQMREQIQNVE